MGENISEEFKRWCEVNNIDLNTTAAESQFGNGMVERHGGLLSASMHRMRQDLPRVSADILMSKAILAHNSLATIDGTVPIQRVIGTIPRLPSVLIDRPSSMALLESELGSHVAYLQTIQSARTASAASQASSSLKRTLASRIQPSIRSSYEIDDKVYFYDRDTGSTKWRGPGRVIGFSPAAKIVVILYGKSTYLRHVTKVRNCFDHGPET